jgi:hypothetical protein
MNSELINLILSISSVGEAVFIVYSFIVLVVRTTKTMAPNPNNSLGYLSLDRFKMDIFTQSKFKYLPIFLVAWPLVAIVSVFFKESELDKLDILVLSMCPCIILFYCTFYYVCHLADVILQRGYDINFKVLDVLNKLAGVKPPQNP